MLKMSRGLCVVGLISACFLLASDKPSSNFPKPPDTEPSKEPFVSPDEALKRWQLPPGFKATLFAAEPDVQQPIAMAFDSRGRLWVAENYTYAQSGVNFDMTLRDRIVILEDVDNDGKFDKRTVFWDQAQKLTSIELGFGGVWALCAPHLLFIPDRNRDDVPDGEPEVILDGWDDNAVRHNIVNGLKWGPDGWLYGRHGILATSRPGSPGTPLEQRPPINCGIWRYHPTRKTVEVVCHGTTNPWGHDWDIHGELFMINTVIGHLWHILPGAHYQRMYGEDLTSPHLYELIPQTADHFHWDTTEAWSDIRKLGVTTTTDQAGGGHAHSGLMIYNGTNWPPEYRGDAFTVNLHGHRINRDALEVGQAFQPDTRSGKPNSQAGKPDLRAGFVAKHRPDFAKTTDPWFRGIDLLCGPDGGVYIADWSDVGECHENDGVHRSSGRIFKLKWETTKPANRKDKKVPPALIPDMVTTPPEQLVEFAVKFNNEWLARQARIRILELADSGTAEQKRRLKVHVSGLGDLRSTFACPDPKAVASEDSSILVSTNTGLRSVWCERLLGLDDDARLLDVLSRGDPRGQSWAIRIMAERGLNDKTSAAVAQSASSSSSGLVLLHLASALQRLPHDARWPIAEALASRGEFAGDPVLPLMVWYGIEPAVPADPDKAVALAESTKMPKLRTFIARRLTHLLAQQPGAANKVVELLGRLSSAESQLNVLTGMKDALAGMRKAPPPAAWASVSKKLNDSGNESVRQAVREVSVVFGDGRAIDEVKKIAAARGSDSESRRQAIRSLVEARAAGLAPLLQNLLDDRDIGPDVIRGLAAISDAGTPRLLLDNYKRLLPPARSEAINTLVSRPAFASPLLDAVAAGSVQRMHVSSFQLRQMQSFGDEQITKRIADLWPELRAISAEKTKKIADYKTTLTPERLATANLPAGRKLFEKSCMSCHILFGQGGNAGPELTGAQRNNLAYLLENIVDPSLTVSANFKMSIVVLTDGRVLNGVVAGKTDQTLTLQTPTERLVLPLGDIEEQRESNLSLMPEGQLDVLKPDDVRDLIGYLMSPQQVAVGKSE